MSPYVLLNGIGFITALFILDRSLGRRLPAKRDFVYVLLVFATLVGWIGARTLDWMLSPSAPTLLGGFVFYGGLLAAAAFSVTVAAFSLTMAEMVLAANVAVMPLSIAHGIGRVGCFLSGCCFGTPCGVLPIKHPVQLYEATFLFGLAIFLARLGDAAFPRRAAYYLIGYPVFRFSIEFYRGDDRGQFHGLSTSQWMSLAWFIVGVLLLSSPLVRLCTRHATPTAVTTDQSRI